MKFFVSADMEGLAAAVSWKEFETDYQRLRRLFTAEVRAVCEGIIDSGQRVERIVVCDAHGSGESLLVDELPRPVRVARGSGRPLMMLHGLDSTFDLALFVGYHSGAGTADAQMDHTYSARSFYRVRLNGIEADEAIINAALAGWYGVPVGFLSGDDKLVRHARKVFGAIETVATKQAVSRFAAITRHPAEVLDELKTKAGRAAQRVREFRPYRVSRGSVLMELQMATTAHADMVALIPGAKRTDGRVLSYRAKDMLEAYRTLRLAAILAGSATAYL
jgi:D-amino peptidase